MRNLKKALINKLKGSKKIAILGVGSDIRGDDALGLEIARKIKKHFQGNSGFLKVFLGHSAPENLTGQIKKFKPSHLIIIDAVNRNLKPGSALLASDYRDKGISFSTHKMPVQIMQDYLSCGVDCKSMIVGIQPENCNFCQAVSKPVESSIKEVSIQIIKALEYVF